MIKNEYRVRVVFEGGGSLTYSIAAQDPVEAEELAKEEYPAARVASVSYIRTLEVPDGA